MKLEDESAQLAGAVAISAPIGDMDTAIACEPALWKETRAVRAGAGIVLRFNAKNMSG